jgi:sulfate transport system substrate-binding protein
MKRHIPLLSTALAIAALGLSACGSSSSSSSSGGGGHLELVAYSTPQSAYAKLIVAFQATPAGRGVTFSQSFGASGQQSKQVLAGLPADVVALSLAPDVDKLAKAGLVSPTWSAGPGQGVVSTTVAVIIVRKGNPKHITGWDDLVRPGVQVVTPNPVSSGSARWNILAAYGAELREGRTPAQADAYLKQLFAHVVSQDTSARNAEQTFLTGRGDALLDYENEAITLQRKGEPVQEVLPSSTILIQNPAAVVTRGGHAALAQRFVDYLQSAPAQQIFASEGFRPTIPSLIKPSEFPAVRQLFTVADLGGWTKLTSDFFDPNNGLVSKIDAGAGG